MATSLPMNDTLERIHGEIQDHLRAIDKSFKKLDKIKDRGRQSIQLEELKEKLIECKRLIKDFENELKENVETFEDYAYKQLNDEKQSMIKQLNTYVQLRKTYLSNHNDEKAQLIDAGGSATNSAADDTAVAASSMQNQELIDVGKKTMDETDQTIERSKMVVEQTIEVGAQTAVSLKGQTEQMGRIVNELDTIQFSIKKATQLVKEIGRKVATDKCIMIFLLLIVCGVVAIIVVKIVNPSNKNIRDIPGLAPPAPVSRRLLAVQHSV